MRVEERTPSCPSLVVYVFGLFLGKSINSLTDISQGLGLTMSGSVFRVSQIGEYGGHKFMPWPGRTGRPGVLDGARDQVGFGGANSMGSE